MFVKTLFFLLPAFLLLAASGNAQVVTSKKEAVKKGVYKKPSEVSSEVQSAVASFSGKESDKTAKSNSTPSKSTNSPAVQPSKTVAATSKPAKQTVAKSKSKRGLINEKNETDVVPEPEENYIAVQMINNAMTFIGTRYLGGGTTASGMDCSGMVTAVYNLFDLKLPRSSTEMAKVGQKIDRKEVKKGDLVFFHTNGRRTINHVGLVVEASDEEIKFVHSSTSKGVIISSTKEPYYERNFVQANRML
ncbi:C40 family peptidase [Flavobacterium selenitireducens]|uniref:C40 family peptidase n=1 Tax=Flavobacterium selenitireducens TaxID=2722704 RepID=UPI00168BB9D1|nr:C40 family peptidase [Flavobacterium selenitireducens]MBD3583143.1 hypothetical protein [Flavobacterium selenitireducens]